MAIEEAAGTAHEDPVQRLRRLRDESAHPAGLEAEKKQHARGKLLARERIDLLLDAGSFGGARSLRRASVERV